MSVIRPDGLKTVLETQDIDEIWRQIKRDYIGDQPERARLIGMLALREISGWTTDMIGDAFGLKRDAVIRALVRVRRELRSQFCLPPRTWKYRR